MGDSPFVIEELKQKIFDKYKFGYDEDSYDEYEKNFIQFIWKRIETFFKEARYAVIEDSYVETEWKDMISLHYINTTYASQLKLRSIRVHFLLDQTVRENTYLGFITLRPIEEMTIALSYVFPNWTALKQQNSGREQICTVTYKKRVHCCNQRIKIETYPVLCQDSVVVCCADVNIITLSRFLSHNFRLKPLGIRDICKDDYNVVYPRELHLETIENLCKQYHIPFRQIIVHLNQQEMRLESDLTVSNIQKEGKITQTYEGLERYLDAYLDSNLPIVIVTPCHAVQVAGYRNCQKNPNQNIVHKEYLILDDSGHYDFNIFKRCGYFVELTKLIDQIRNGLEAGRETILLYVPIYDRVYIDYAFYEGLLCNELKTLWKGRAYETYYKKIFDPNGYFQKCKDGIPVVKSQLIESSVLLQKLKDRLSKTPLLLKYSRESIEQALNRLEQKPLAHYLWYTEFDLNGVFCAVFADTTRRYDTMHLDKLFLNINVDEGLGGVIWLSEPIIFSM